MSLRRAGREAAVQFLYKFSAQPASAPLTSLLKDFWSTVSLRQPAKTFAESLIRGTIANLPTIDDALRAAADNWELERITVIDRAILRVAAYELLHTQDTPVKVAINEAVEIAKQFSAEDAPAFINGVLDRLLREHRSSTSTS